MHTSVLERKVMEVEATLLEIASALDPDDVPASEAPRVFARLDRIARAATAARTVLARRVADSREWQRKGFRSPEEHLAATAGTSLGAARAEMATSEALRSLPGTRQGMLEGTLSPAQGTVIAAAATVNRDAEDELIAAAQRSNLRELQDQAARARAAADPDPSATHARIHRQRRVTRHSDAEGGLHLHAQGTADEGAEILAELDRLVDEIFHERRSSGIRETRDAYAWDALLRMARRSRHGSAEGRHASTNPKFLGLLRVDVEALHRGRADGDELCEISGVGPIPVDVAKRLLGEATLKLVITRGVDVLNVTSLGRGPTAAMRYAMAWSEPTCAVEGCSRTLLEYDHRSGAEFAKTRHTRLGELDGICPGHHDLHTNHGWALVAGTGKRPMVPPDDPRHPCNIGPVGHPTTAESASCDPPPSGSARARAAPGPAPPASGDRPRRAASEQPDLFGPHAA